MVRFRWSAQVIVITSLIGTLWVGAIFALICFLPAGTFKGIIVTIFITVLGYCVTRMPVKIRVDKDAIRIKRLLGTKVIPLSAIVRVERLKGSQLGGFIRIMGSGGFCGYFGRFYSKDLGKFTMFATEKKYLMLVVTSTCKYVISCRRPDMLVGLGRPQFH